MASRKRCLDSPEHTPRKRQRLSNNNHNHNNHNRNHSDSNGAGRQHPHYIKYAPLIRSISPYDISSSSNDVMFTGTNAKDVEIRKLRTECRELKERLRILRRIAISNYVPEYGIIAIDKTNGTIASKRIALLKKKILSIYNKTTIKVKINNDQHKKYSKSIKTFLKKNKNTTNHSNNAMNPYIASSMDDDGYVWHKQRDLLQLLDDNKFSSDGHPIITDATDEHEMMGNVSVQCQYDIESNTVVGEYVGLQLTVNEMESIYSYSYQKCLANLYGFDVELDLEDIDFDEDEDEEEDKNEMEEIKEVMEEIQTEGSKIVIDAIGYQQLRNIDHLLLYIQPVEKEDDRIANVECVSAVINGWPRIFVVSKRWIETGEALCGHFGDMFKMAEYQRLRDKRSRMRMGIYIDNMLRMPLFMTNREETIYER